MRELLRSLSPANVVRVYKVLRAVRFFRGHRYVYGRALENYARILFLRQRRLRVAELSLGNACQLRCEHCYATDLTTATAPLAEVKASIDALDRLGCLSIMLVGGEPTLRKDLLDIVSAIRARRMVPFMFSNAQLLDRERLAELKDAGLFGLMVSVLGVGERHDAFVHQEGAFARALAAVDAARELGLFVSLNTTPTHQLLAAGEFTALARLAEARGVGLKFNYPALLGRFAGRDEELLDAAERRFLDQELDKPHVSNDMRTSYFDRTCPAGAFALYVADNGEVTPCAYIPISFGNLHEEPIETIHQRMVTSPFFGRVQRLCLVGEDRDFIARFVAPTFAATDLPMRWDKHPLRDELVAAPRPESSPAAP